MKPIWLWELRTDQQGIIITIYHSYAAWVASISPGYFYLLIYYCYEVLISHSLVLWRPDNKHLTRLAPAQTGSQLWISAANNYMIALCPAQHTSLLSSVMIVIDQTCCACLPLLTHSIIYQPEKTCPQNFNNENILTVKCSTDPRWGHLTFPTSNKEKTKTKVVQGLKELPYDLSWWCLCAL